MVEPFPSVLQTLLNITNHNAFTLLLTAVRFSIDCPEIFKKYRAVSLANFTKRNPNFLARRFMRVRRACRTLLSRRC